MSVHVRATEEGKEDNVVTEDNVEEKGGRRGGPKKLFKWNEEIRSEQTSNFFRFFEWMLFFKQAINDLCK